MREQRSLLKPQRRQSVIQYNSLAERVSTRRGVADLGLGIRSVTSLLLFIPALWFICSAGFLCQGLIFKRNCMAASHFYFIHSTPNLRVNNYGNKLRQSYVSNYLRKLVHIQSWAMHHPKSMSFSANHIIIANYANHTRAVHITEVGGFSGAFW